MLGLDFIKTNVALINVKERKLTLACGNVVSFRERDSSLDNFLQRTSVRLWLVRFAPRGGVHRSLAGRVYFFNIGVTDRRASVVISILLVMF